MWRMVVVLMIVGLCVHTAAALPGSGTQQDPWRIESLADFDEFAADPNYWAGYTRLETDVNLAGRTYTTAVIASLTGVFDGNDHKITALTIDGGGGNWYLGLFGCIDDGEVRNLGLEGGSVNGYYCVGGLVGANGDYPQPGGAITNCYSTGNVNGVVNVGGLVGMNDGIISNCYSTGDVSGDGSVGGLVGHNGGPVSNCYSTGDVSGGYGGGGPVGVGGLVGSNGDWYHRGSISNCYSTGDVNGVWCLGGLVGYFEKGDIGRSFWDVQTSGRNKSAGGIGKTTAEMMTMNTFIDAGWDFVEVWGIGENQTYPFLRFAPAGDLNYDKKVNLFDLAIFASHWLENTP